MSLVARSADIKMLEERIKYGKTTRERELARDKMAQLDREDKDPIIGNLREQLVQAARASDSAAGDKISEQLYLHQLKIGKIREK